MLIIRSRETTQELRRLSSNLSASSITLGLTDKSSRPRRRDRQHASRVRSLEMHRSDVAPAPFKLLPDYTKERSIGQRRQWKRFLCFADGDDRSAFHEDRSAAIQRQVHWIIGMTRFDFDDRFIRDNDRAVCKHMRANRRNDENAGLGIENRSPGRQ